MKKSHAAMIGLLGGMAIVSTTTAKTQAVDVSRGYGTTSNTQQQNYEDSALAMNLSSVSVPSAKPTPTQLPSAKPTATPTPKISAKPTATPTPKLSPKLSPTPDATPSAKVSPKVTPTPEPKPTAKVSPKQNPVAATVVGAITETYKSIFETISRLFHF